MRLEPFDGCNRFRIQGIVDGSEESIAGRIEITQKGTRLPFPVD